ncbi:anhydro-N-acetylmuramic acid kinase [Fodinibius salsisoli]|uniref:Anhydro-N-acetylmuramic acid kinase n=1 Tax=Fodinibius salsisoli TaxID=2820877 RepID=A0ABT3PJA5_9BACT|nr:anhydro-N-acetylmuramic acid kinase [Fodinibius salsisoli]MCW9706001.1 anhydro-N-acetylmuramic acid kinase [Fodinibius salsisoli]
MNNQISLLAQAAQKKKKIILGLMSGTSMDGLDLVLCQLTGKGKETEISLLEFETVAYSEKLKDLLQKVISVPRCSLEDVCLMHTYLGHFTAEIILDTLEGWRINPSEVDCIASHGQTIYHAPKSKHQRAEFPHATLQIGDGDHIAHKTGILTISDFRQKHTAAGGEGAPMAALIDQLLFRDSHKDRILLNIGGIANFTYVPASSALDAISADTGPGNTLLDAAARRLLDKPFDEGGTEAQKGVVNKALLEALKANPYFEQAMPKTTGPELFNWKYVEQARDQANVKAISDKDLLATLVELTAETIAEAIKKVDASDEMEILTSGGGIHNNALMYRLKQQLPKAAFVPFGAQYFNPDAKEAVCFAVLANEALSGKGFQIGLNEKKERVNFGKVSFPK